MTIRRYANNAASATLMTVTSGQTGLTVSAGDGALFPQPTAGDWFIGTLDDGSGTIEIVKVTSRTGDAMIIERAQEGTIPTAFPAGVAFELRATAASFSSPASLPSTYVAGDLLYATNTTSLTTLAIGTSGKVLTSSGTAPQWSAFINGALKGDLLYVSSNAPTLARLAVGTTGQALGVSSGLPAWGSGGSTTRLLPIAQADLPDASGSGNNPPSLARSISSVTQTANTPKVTYTMAQFDAATDEHLEWTLLVPSNYTSTPTVRLVYHMNTATGSRTVWKAAASITAVGVSSTNRAFLAAVTGAATNGATAASTRVVTIALTTTGIASNVNRPMRLFVGRDADATGDTATGDANLTAVQFEWT